MQGCFDICKSVHVIHDINRIKGKKNHIIIWTDTKNAFDKIQQPFKIKAPKKTKIEETYLNKIKAIHNKPIGNIVFNELRWNHFL
jgi:hypothetical protein